MEFKGVNVDELGVVVQDDGDKITAWVYDTNTDELVTPEVKGSSLHDVFLKLSAACYVRR